MVDRPVFCILRTFNFKLLVIMFEVIIWNLFILQASFTYLYAQQKKEDPIIVNGDIVEYSTESKEVTASGNVEVTYKGAKLTCDKLTVNTQTKDAVAQGNARLDDQKGVVEGKKLIYNFETKTGTIIDSNFRANPYFGKGPEVKKVSDNEFVVFNGYATTCSLDQPHYRIKSKEMRLFPEDKIQTKNNIFYVGKTPIFYLPRYNHSLKEPFMHVRFVPGKSKDWGPYLLSAWRYNLTEHISGRIYFDYREQLGVAEGFGANYNTGVFGKGDFKYYYTQERSRKFQEGIPAEFQRYFIRLRHKWDIDERTNLTSEYHKIVDAKRMILGSEHNILKDYFFREYEKDSQPLSYVLLHRSFIRSNIDIIVQKRTNRWYSQLEKLPEVSYSLPSLQIENTPLYLDNNTQIANFNYKYAVPSSSTNDVNAIRFDTNNKFSLPTKVAFINFTPFVSDRVTYYDKDIYGSATVFRTAFSSGVDVSTKFYRLFDVKSKFLGMDINRLRHIITPSISYSYTHEPSFPNSKLKQIDSIDSITRGNSAGLELSNKLQTKRGDQSVDFLDARISTTYNFKPKTDSQRGSNLSDFLFEMKLLPYSWLRVETDVTYKHSGGRGDANYNKLSNVNYDFIFDFAKERSFSIGQRYQRKGGNEIIYSLNWRFSPKWRFSLYHRHQWGHDPTLSRGLKEQEYTVSRDLHCWQLDVTYNVNREHGETVYVVFRLKAFPEMEFGFDQSYHKPKSGSQSNP